MPQQTEPRTRHVLLAAMLMASGCYSKHAFAPGDMSDASDTDTDLAARSPLTWRPVDSSVDHPLRAISCPSADLCVIVGVGIALRSTNGGETWIGSPLASYDINDVDCPTTERCYAATANKKFLHSTDGGMHWDSRPMPTLRRHAEALACGGGPLQCSAITNYVVEVLQTIDGDTWTRTPAEIVGNHSMHDIACPAPDACVAVGYASENPFAASVLNLAPGQGWTFHQPDDIGKHRLFAVSCTADRVCYAAGEGFSIWKTVDLGKSWSKTSRPTNRNLLGISCPSNDVCYAVGDQGAGMFTQDGGTIWREFKLGDELNYEAIDCVTENHCIAVGSSGTIRVGKP